MQTMPHTIFFSWQNEILPEYGRNFIERALNSAIKGLSSDLEIEPALRNPGLTVDRDTRGVAGTPPIVDTILKKIDAAAVFVGDLTFIGTRRDGRPTPNPNVLLEYGWALKSRGYPRIIVLMNTAFGEPDDKTLPFNMKHLRWPMTFCLPEGSDDATKQRVRADLAKALKGALRDIVDSDEFKAALPPPPEIPRFVELEPADPPARFRKRSETLGIREAPFGIGTVGEIKLADGPAIWLRVMPEFRQQQQWGISELRDKMRVAGSNLLPLGNFSAWGPVRAAEGYGMVPAMQDNPEIVPAVILAFKSGEVWSVYVGPLGMKDEVINLESTFVECFVRCVTFLCQGLKIKMPYRWVAGAEGIKGKRMQRWAPPGRSYWEPLTGPSLVDSVVERGLLAETDKVQLALRPFFQSLYEAFGYTRGDHYDDALLRRFPDP